MLVDLSGAVVYTAELSRSEARHNPYDVTYETPDALDSAKSILIEAYPDTTTFDKSQLHDNVSLTVLVGGVLPTPCQARWDAIMQSPAGRALHSNPLV